MIALAVFVWIAGIVLLAAAKWRIRPCRSLAEAGPSGDSNAVACAPEPAVPVRNRDVAAAGGAGTNAVPVRVSEPFQALRVFSSDEAGPPEPVLGTPAESDTDF